MNDYDFSTLNDKEFENISIELISREKNQRFERFKIGKDGGVDGRFFRDDGKEEIIQCKHYLKTGYKGLISSLKTNGEKNKVVKLDPEKYIFATSLPLSMNNKEEIRKLFEPYIKNDNDIYGQEDLNDILKKNPNIEEAYYKLWISSTTVFNRILNNAIKGRSEFKIDEIKDKIKFYVVTDNHHKAIKKLEESHTIIIAGEPGIGKTTLAEQMALYYIEKDFEFYIIEDSLKEAEDVFEKDKKQLFYFDNFLGSNFLDAIHSHKDSHIMNFIARVKKDKNKRFILTSRTNILNQGFSLSDTFKNKNINSDEFIIKFESLEDIDKARILYNHIWHSNFDNDYIEEIYKEKRYRTIINHKNFNPRIIEFITRREEVTSSCYWDHIIQKLDNPIDIWTHTFDVQSDDFIRNIVLLTVFNGNSIDENALKSAYNNLNDLLHTQNTSHLSKEFDSVIKKVIKYFLKRTHNYMWNKIEYSLFNPSIADFIINRYKNDKILIKIFQSLKTEQSLTVIFNLYHNKLIDRALCEEIISGLDFSINDNMDFLVEFAYLMYLLCEEEVFSKDKSLEFSKNINLIIGMIMNKNDKINKDVYKVLKPLSYLDENKVKITPKFLNQLIQSVESYDEESIARLVCLFTDNKFNTEEFKPSLDLFNNLLEEYILEGIKNENYRIRDSVIKNSKQSINQIINENLEDEIKAMTTSLIDNTYMNITGYVSKYIDIKTIQDKAKVELLKDIKYDCSEFFEEDKDEKSLSIKEKQGNNDLSKDCDIDDLFEKL